VRDLLHKRDHPGRSRTSLMNSLQGIASRNRGCKPGINEIKRPGEDRITPLLADQEDPA